MTFPILHVDGTAYDQGRQHGAALRDAIDHNLAVYVERFATEGQLPLAEARARAERYLPRVATHPAFDAIRGVADGSGHDVLDVLLLNLRYELLYYQFGVCAVPDGCTAFAVLPGASANGHLLIGQNWDWIPQVRGAVLHTREPDGLETLSFTEAGIVGGKIGLNSAGLGLAINGLLSTADDWSRLQLPFHLRCYDILRSRDLDAAVSIVTRTRRACSANFILAQTPARLVDLEAAPDSLRELAPTDGYLVHTNHFLDPRQLGVEEPPSERRPHSYLRLTRMQSLLDARRPVSVADLEACLRDHDDYPDSICRHVDQQLPPEEHYITVASAIMDLDERSLRLTDGQPCERLYEGVSLAHTAIISH